MRRGLGRCRFWGEVTLKLEIDDTDDEGDVGMADSGSWWDGARWPWGQPNGG